MEKNDAFFKAFPFTIGITIVIATALWIIFEQKYGMSFALGSFTMLYTMSMLNKSSKRVLESDKVTAQRLTIRNYFFRYLFYAVVLVAAGLLPNLDVLTTGIGLFLFKIVFYIIILFDRRGEKKQ